jgi:hypothetical protein
MLLIFRGFLREKNFAAFSSYRCRLDDYGLRKVGSAKVARLENHRRDHINNSAKTPSATATTANDEILESH